MRKVTEKEKQVMAQIPTVNIKASWSGGIPILTDDMEEQDKTHIAEYIESYMNASYPEFEPEIITVQRDEWTGASAPTVHYKQYFLPALKVLDYDGEYFYSPQKDIRWNNLELVAECLSSMISPFGMGVKRFTKMYLGVWNDEEDVEEEHEDDSHSVPHKGCDCGIYGSVNIEEICEWLRQESHSFKPIRWDVVVKDLGDDYDPSTFAPPPKQKVLCIIEPSPDADVILCRKGWKASKAFISEIVGANPYEHVHIRHTMTVEQASGLLSIAWKRNIDVKGVYKNENW